MDRHFDATIFIYDGVTALDAVGPYESLRRLPGVSVGFAGLVAGPVTAGGSLRLMADEAIGDIGRTDLLLLPGGTGKALQLLIADAALLGWVRKIHETTRWTTSVCTGSLLLAAAGLLRNVPASTHWRAKAALPKFGAVYSSKRITESGKIITSAGVSAGIDLGIRLCAAIAGDEMGRAVQLGMEYAPEPPFAVGTPENEPALVKIVEQVLLG